jgi:hypothetical protein
MDEQNKYWLVTCLREIEVVLGWGSGNGWSNADFENLAERIFDKTGTRLSVSTLKRIWGRVSYNHFPNSASLTALAVFAGYEDWRGFCSKHFFAGTDPTIPVKEIIVRNQQPVFLQRFAWVLLVLVLVAAIGWLAFTSRKPVKANIANHYSFSSRKVTDDLPNSVVFHYNAAAAGDSIVMIQQSWDSTRSERVDAAGTEHTSIYYYPGYFLSKLTVNGRIVLQSPVFIETKGWKAIAQRDPVPVYFDNESIHLHTGISVTSQQLAKAFNATEFSNRWVQFDNFRDFSGIKGDDFAFISSLRNTASAVESPCRKVRIIIRGTEDVIITEFCAGGCIADLNLYTGDSAISGRDHDLSAFGCDFKTPHIISCRISDHRFTVLIDNKPVFGCPANKPMGEIKGIRVLFEGPGEILNASLSGGNGTSYDLMKQ